MNEMNEIKIPKGVDRIAVKQHNDKVVIEFIPEEAKFKRGDKVRIKDGISSKTHKEVSPSFNSAMDRFIGKELTVQEYTNDGFVILFEDYIKFYFREDWLEPWSDELKKGDLAIFWDNEYGDYPLIRMYDSKDYRGYYDSCGLFWDSAIKFESKEQFEKVLRGETN